MLTEVTVADIGEVVQQESGSMYMGTSLLPQAVRGVVYLQNQATCRTRSERCMTYMPAISCFYSDYLLEFITSFLICHSLCGYMARWILVEIPPLSMTSQRDGTTYTGLHISD
jgi:hypothetical protein